jgi:hypothetical protein
LSDQPSFCPKCGAQVVPGAGFCSKCGSPLTGATPSATGTATTMTPRYYRHEKGEKQEKHEKGEKREKGRGGEITGPLIGGGILIWLGILVYLQLVSIIGGADFGGLFLMGIGVLLILGGLIRRTTSGYPILGYIIGGIVLILIGIASLGAFNKLLGAAVGAIILVGLGILVIVVAITARRRSPAP